MLSDSHFIRFPVCWASKIIGRPSLYSSYSRSTPCVSRQGWSVPVQRYKRWIPNRSLSNTNTAHTGHSDGSRDQPDINSRICSIRFFGHYYVAGVWCWANDLASYGHFLYWSICCEGDFLRIRSHGIHHHEKPIVWGIFFIFSNHLISRKSQNRRFFVRGEGSIMEFSACGGSSSKRQNLSFLLWWNWRCLTDSANG